MNIHKFTDRTFEEIMELMHKLIQEGAITSEIRNKLIRVKEDLEFIKEYL